MALYLLGIFMGALDTGIITPARPLISTQLGVDESAGIWMITIYTLAYAAAIPIMGKLADRSGRKPIYLLSIALFGAGSLLCGLSQDVGSFGMLIAARALQAIGGGGILPIATAEVGTTVPQERRGLALGLVGAVYGVANIFGASAGSLVLQIAGAENWQWIFYINIPITLAILVTGALILPNHTSEKVAPIDVWGSLVLVAMILSLLYGLRNLDYLDVATSITSTEVWPFLAAFLALLPVLIVVERRAADPVLHLSYFTDRGIALTLLLSLLSGVILMGVVFVPEFAENALRLPAGSGGYAVIALGLTSGVGAPLSGRLTDRFGPRLVLGFGALICLLAAVSLIGWAIPAPSTVSVMVSLCLLGLGLGFVVGSPLNYMMLERTAPEDSSSALATLSLMRSIGTTLAPAVMVGFLAQAGGVIQADVTAALPRSVPAPALPHAAELQATLTRWKSDPDLADRLGTLDPALLAPTDLTIDPTAGGTLPEPLVQELRTADVTTIVAVSKDVARAMFARETPHTIETITAGVTSGIDGVDAGLAGTADAEKKMTDSLATMSANLTAMAEAQQKMSRQLNEMDEGLAGMRKGVAGLDAGIAGMKKGIAGLDRAVAGMDEGLTAQRAALAGAEQGAAAAAHSPDPGVASQAAAQLAGLRGAVQDLENKRAAAVSQRTGLQAKLDQAVAKRADLVASQAKLQQGRSALAQARTKLTRGRDELLTAHSDLTDARAALLAKQDELRTTREQMVELRDAIPAAFDTALTTYLDEIDQAAPDIELAYQRGLNQGFRGVYLLFGGAAALALVALALVGRPRT
ncbi:MFS transporter [Propioniciclava flava]|uniref:MFS transporter n=2 Tax=Propioniciclava flava TaxID=2072026 RepID=A0A4Q2ECT8_9ACTN|nr:MFS transporter [Propioniciclava flava]